MDTRYDWPLHWYIGPRIKPRLVWFHRRGVLQSLKVVKHVPFKETRRGRSRTAEKHLVHRTAQNLGLSDVCCLPFSLSDVLSKVEVGHDERTGNEEDHT